jgi:hypothetical protein
MVNERFQWRTNPAVIAQYYTGEQVPNSADVHLKPNEACAVIENGSIVTVASGTRLTVNPEMSMLSKLLARREPFRSFLFTHTGPHEVLIPLAGVWADGAKATGMAGLKINFNKDNLGRLLMYPSKGKNTVTLGDLAASMGLEISQKMASAHLSSHTLADVKTNPAATTLLESGLRSIAQASLSDSGATLERVWISWTPNEHERIASMQQELEFLAEEGRIINEKDRIEMERLLAQEVNVLERQHQLNVAMVEYEQKSLAMKEIAVMRVNAEKERERFSLLAQRDSLQAENLLQRARLDSVHEDSTAQYSHENRMNQLDRTMDFEDREAELERRRRERKMGISDQQAAFLRQQETKAAVHHEKMLKGVFDAMDSEDEDEA